MNRFCWCPLQASENSEKTLRKVPSNYSTDFRCFLVQTAETQIAALQRLLSEFYLRILISISRAYTHFSDQQHIFVHQHKIKGPHQVLGCRPHRAHSPFFSIHASAYVAPRLLCQRLRRFFVHFLLKVRRDESVCLPTYLMVRVFASGKKCRGWAPLCWTRRANSAFCTNAGVVCMQVDVERGTILQCDVYKFAEQYRTN